MKKLIISADDFGMSKAINEAILTGIERRFITSTNIMMNMQYCLSDNYFINNRNIVSVGLHINLTVGRPISDIRRVSSLVDCNGNFYDSTGFKRRWNRGKIKKDEVILEIKEQYHAFVLNFGYPDYINTHQHIHMLPGFLFLLNTMSKEDIKISAIRNNKRICVGDSENFKLKVKNVAIDMIYGYLDNKIIRTDGLLLFTDNEIKYDVPKWAPQVIWNKNNVAELMIHPAVKVDSDYFGKLRESRIKEFEMCIDSNSFDALISNGICLCKFNEL